MSAVQEKQIKGLMEYTEEDLRQGLKEGQYHFRVVDANGGYWDEEMMDVRFDLRSVVVGGEYEGKFGPTKTWSFNAFEYDNEETGVSFSRSRSENIENFIRDIHFRIHGGRPLPNIQDYTKTELDDVGEQLKGDEFIAVIGEDKNGFPRMNRVYSMANPPKGFKVTGAKKGFSLA